MGDACICYAEMLLPIPCVLQAPVSPVLHVMERAFRASSFQGERTWHTTIPYSPSALHPMLLYPSFTSWSPCSQVRREHQILSARLLALFRKIDLLEARSASALGLWDDSSVEATAAIARSLNALEGKLAPSAPSAC